MSNQALAWWATCDKSGMRPSTVCVGWLLADRVRDRTHVVARLSHAQLARETGFGTTTVRRALYELRDAGVIRIDARFDGHGQMPGDVHWCGWIAVSADRGCCERPSPAPLSRAL